MMRVHHFVYALWDHARSERPTFAAVDAEAENATEGTS